MKGGVKVKSKKLAYKKILVLFCIIAVLVLMTGCDGNKPIVLFFFALPTTIDLGESSTLFWAVGDADTVSIIPGGFVGSSGDMDVYPVENTEYTLIATNIAGSVSATFTIYLYPVHNLTKDTYYKTIQAALDGASDDNIIEVGNGFYDEIICFPSNKKIILQSKNGPGATIIRGDENSFTVKLDNSLPGTTIKGFTITHDVWTSGGGIFNDGGNLTIDNCIISDNAASSGGGIYNTGTLIIKGESEVIDNTADQGGGIYNLVGTLTIEGASIISCNKANKYGGGIRDTEGTLIITGKSTVSDNNAASSGGGIYLLNVSTPGPTKTITACTISGNSAGKDGGGIFIDGGLLPTITACTISGNSAGKDGGGIFIYGDTSYILPITTLGGSSGAEKNTICGNYKSSNSPSLDQQIRDSSYDLSDIYKYTNHIYAKCEF